MNVPLLIALIVSQFALVFLFHELSLKNSFALHDRRILAEDSGSPQKPQIEAGGAVKPVLGSPQWHALREIAKDTVNPVLPPRLFVGVFTSFDNPQLAHLSKYNYTARRELLRATWFPDAATRATLEQELGIVVRWIVGLPPPRAPSLSNATATQRESEPAEASEDSPAASSEPSSRPSHIDLEEDLHGGFMRLPTYTERYTSLASKTKAFITEVVRSYDPDFILKIDDDALLRLDRLLQSIKDFEKKHSAAQYIGCMKKGPVMTDPKYRWYERDHHLLGKEYPLHVSV